MKFYDYVCKYYLDELEDIRDNTEGFEGMARLASMHCEMMRAMAQEIDKLKDEIEYLNIMIED